MHFFVRKFRFYQGVLLDSFIFSEPMVGGLKLLINVYPMYYVFDLAQLVSFIPSPAKPV